MGGGQKERHRKRAEKAPNLSEHAFTFRTVLQGQTPSPPSALPGLHQEVSNNKRHIHANTHKHNINVGIMMEKYMIQQRQRSVTFGFRFTGQSGGSGGQNRWSAAKSLQRVYKRTYTHTCRKPSELL